MAKHFFLKTDKTDEIKTPPKKFSWLQTIQAFVLKSTLLGAIQQLSWMAVCPSYFIYKPMSGFAHPVPIHIAFNSVPLLLRGVLALRWLLMHMKRGFIAPFFAKPLCIIIHCNLEPLNILNFHHSLSNLGASDSDILTADINGINLLV